MMNYIPHPWHLFVFPTAVFAIGVACLRSDRWNTLGIILLALGVLVSAIIAWALIWDVFIRKAQAMQYLFESARYLDSEMVDRLLYAMGLQVKIATPSSNVTVTKVIPSGAFEKQTIYNDIPASPEQLQKLAIGTLNEHAPFSRPEWVDRRAVFSDSRFRTFKTYLWEKKLIELVNQANVNDGYRFTDAGVDLLTGYLPSPTPQLETA
jgi:hypothetical protein